MGISTAWLDLVPALQQGQHEELLCEVQNLREQGKNIFPPQEHIFRALELVQPQDVSCIILGQDPYHGAGQAQGLAFSVPSDTAPKALPPSLKNIFKEIASDICAGKDADPKLTSNFDPLPNPCLERWAKQGVLLLNTVLTVEEGKAHSHAKLGWQNITTAILSSLAKQSQPLAVLLWGKPAASYAELFTAQSTAHFVVMAAHPSPLSAHRGFFGCKHFSKVNAWLKTQNKKPILW